MDQADRLRALSAGSGKPGPRIMSVTSGKGGVGKSSIAVNMAATLARKGVRVLLVDADLGLANVNLLLGCKVGRTIEDLLHDDVSWDDIFVPVSSGFDVLPSSSGLRSLLDLDVFAQRTLFDRLHDAFEGYDVVILDTAPGLGNHVLDFNALAHDIVVVSHAEPTALADSYALIKVLATERKEKRFKLVVNRARSAQEGLETYKKLTDVSDEFLSVSVDYLGSLPEDSAVSRAVKFQKPAALHEPFAPFSMAVERMADKLLAAKSSQITRSSWNTGNMIRVAEGGL